MKFWRDVALDVAHILRNPRAWWRSLSVAPCPVCGEELSTKGGMWSDWHSHRAIHGNEAWKAALTDR